MRNLDDHSTVIAAQPDHTRSPHWVSRAAFPVLTLCFAVTQAALGFAVYYAQIWIAVPLVLLLSHLMHGQLIGFHEASHGHLRKSRTLNEIDGLILGVFSFMSFSLYRAAHQTHHMHLGTERDEELWPFVMTNISRWKRVLAAVLELTAGLIFTPSIFMRTFFRSGSPIRSTKVRRRIWAELIMMATIWAGILAMVAWLDAWRYFLWLYLVPAFIAANLQSWRKYIEHVGLTGSTTRSATRSIVADTTLGRLFAFTLLHEPFHGVHHLHVGLTHAELPSRVSSLAPEMPDEKPPFPSYTRALVDLLECLKDPKVGPQWQSY
jgi:fatty acid desaturase